MSQPTTAHQMEQQLHVILAHQVRGFQPLNIDLPPVQIGANPTDLNFNAPDSSAHLVTIGL